MAHEWSSYKMIKRSKINPIINSQGNYLRGNIALQKLYEILDHRDRESC